MLVRKRDFDSIEIYLTLLNTSINLRSSLNILDLNIHSENFFRDFLNLIFSWHLENMNFEHHNSESIDLIDNESKILVQVSSINSRPKINGTLQKLDGIEFVGYHFLFVDLGEPDRNVFTRSYVETQFLVFDKKMDIINSKTILRIVENNTIEQNNKILKFLSSELINIQDMRTEETNLAAVINLISEISLDDADEISSFVVDTYRIEEKIEFNNLQDCYEDISDFSIYAGKIQKIYDNYAETGRNKTKSIFHAIRSMLKKLITENPGMSDSELFLGLVGILKSRVIESINYIPVMSDELDMYVKIIVVDAFIKCKIFKNPKGYPIYVTTN